MALLNPKLDEELLAREFAGNLPFRHVVIDNFLDAEFCRRLMAEFPAFDARKAVNELGEAGGKAVVSHLASIGPAYAAFDGLMKDQAFLKTMGRITGIEKLLYDPDYIGGGTHENLHGQDLDFHIDFNYHPKRHTHRRLNLILFLNREWRAEWGGCLELQRDPWSGAAQMDDRMVIPIANRAVIFETTEASWHGFRRIQLPAEYSGLSRRSLAVYFYTAERPASQTAASHGTAYVPRPLPERLAAGYQLSAADVVELETLIARRDAQIRYLYERELEHSEVLRGVLRSPSFRVGRMVTWPFRMLRGGK